MQKFKHLPKYTQWLLGTILFFKSMVACFCLYYKYLNKIDLSACPNFFDSSLEKCLH